jgi:hypothetical protein
MSEVPRRRANTSGVSSYNIVDHEIIADVQ